VSDRGRHASPAGPRPGDRLVRVGALVFAVGVVGILGIVVPFFLERDEAPVIWSVLASMAPLGLALALLGLLVGARADRG
jgi:RsiW-degrading membrane proteinase PrsW (M82 family)